MGRQFAEKDAFDMVGVNAEDKVVMVGFFGPVIPKLKQTGCKLDVLELKSNRPWNHLPEDGGKELAECSVAIITATSIITDTFDDLMAGLGNPRAVIVLGPSDSDVSTGIYRNAGNSPGRVAGKECFRC